MWHVASYWAPKLIINILKNHDTQTDVTYQVEWDSREGPRTGRLTLIKATQAYDFEEGVPTAVVARALIKIRQWHASHGTYPDRTSWAS